MDLIRTRGERMSALRNSLKSPFHFWRQIDEEIKEQLQALVQAGELSENEANHLIEKLLSPAADTDS